MYDMFNFENLFEVLISSIPSLKIIYQDDTCSIFKRCEYQIRILYLISLKVHCCLNKLQFIICSVSLFNCFWSHPLETLNLNTILLKILGLSCRFKRGPRPTKLLILISAQILVHTTWFCKNMVSHMAEKFELLFCCSKKLYYSNQNSFKMWSSGRQFCKIAFSTMVFRFLMARLEQLSYQRKFELKIIWARKKKLSFCSTCKLTSY